MKKLMLCILSRPFSVLMLTFAVFLSGLMCAFRTRIEFLPTIDIPVVEVITEFPGLPPQQMEELITIPLENALSSVSGMKEISSLTRKGICAVTLTFGWERKNRRDIEVRERIDSVYPILPYGAKKPIVQSRQVMEEPFMTLAVYPLSGVDKNRMEDLVEDELKGKLLSAPAVSSLRISGLTGTELVVEAHREKLASASLDIVNLSEAVRTGIIEAPAGVVCAEGREQPLRVTSGVHTVKGIEALPVMRDDGRAGPFIADVGTVYEAEREARSFFHVNGKAAVGIFLYPSEAYGELYASREMKQVVSELSKSFENELTITIIEDGSERIAEEMRGLILSLLVSVIGSLAVLSFCMGSFRLACITTVSIPLSLSVVLIIMAALRMSINLISVLGLALGTGMVVDNSIIVVIQLNGSDLPSEEADRMIGAIAPCSGSTLTGMLVFFPIFFFPGMTGALFRDLALTIISLLSTSLICAFTAIPALYCLCKGKSVQTAKTESGRKKKAGLSRRAATLTLTLISASALILLMKIPSRILPETQVSELEGFFVSQTRIPILEAEKTVSAVAEALRTSGYAEHVLFWAGYDEHSPQDRVRQRNGLEYLHFSIIASGRKPLEELRTEFARIVRGCTALPFVLGKKTDPFETLLGYGETREVIVTEVLRDRVEGRTERLSTLLSESGIEVIPLPASQSDRGLSLCFDRAALSRLSVDMERLMQVLVMETEGAVVTRMEDGEGRWTDVRVRGKPLHSPEELLDLTVKGGGNISLKDMAGLSPEAGEEELFRYDRTPAQLLLIRSSPDEEDTVNEIIGTVEGAIPPSESIVRAGSQEIAVIFSLAVFAMFILLAAQFESLMRSFLCIVSIPVSAAGSLLALILMGMSLNLYSFLGMLLLSGTVINSPIILASGSSGEISSIIATTVTTVIGIIPLLIVEALRGSPQAETASAFLGGMVWGTVVVLLVFPSILRKDAEQRGGEGADETEKAA